MGHALLATVRNKDLGRERQQLAQVRQTLLPCLDARAISVREGKEEASRELHVWFAWKRRHEGSDTQFGGVSNGNRWSNLTVSGGPPAGAIFSAHACEGRCCRLMSRSWAQVVGHLPLRHNTKVSAVSPPGQPLVQLMLPAAQELAKAPGGTTVGASHFKVKRALIK